MGRSKTLSQRGRSSSPLAAGTASTVTGACFFETPSEGCSRRSVDQGMSLRHAAVVISLDASTVGVKFVGPQESKSYPWGLGCSVHRCSGTPWPPIFQCSRPTGLTWRSRRCAAPPPLLPLAPGLWGNCDRSSARAGFQRARFDADGDRLNALPRELDCCGPEQTLSQRGSSSSPLAAGTASTVTGACFLKRRARMLPPFGRSGNEPSTRRCSDLTGALWWDRCCGQGNHPSVRTASAELLSRAIIQGLYDLGSRCSGSSSDRAG